MLKNPFVVYILSFGGVLAVYQLGWSEVYPSLSSDLLVFFGITFLVSSLLAFAVSGTVGEIKGYEPGKLPNYTTLVLVASFAADIIYTGSVPLLSILEGNFDYAWNIGVPHLAVFNGTFGGVFSTIRFADFLYSKRPRYLVEALIPIIYFILVVYRGPVLICAVSWAFVYFVKRTRIGVMRGSLIAVLSLLALLLFGLFGDFREGEGAIQSIGRPTAAFRDSGIPKTYFWTYIYMTSPMANLQLAVAAPDFETNVENTSATEFVVSEMLPDFISKRILPLLNAERVKTPEVSRGLNVATMFGRSFVYVGWTGPVLLFILLAALIVVYLRLIRRSPYRVPCLALLNTFIVFCTFHNMIAYTGLILQLVWPIIIGHWPFYRRSEPEFGLQPMGDK